MNEKIALAKLTNFQKMLVVFGMKALNAIIVFTVNIPIVLQDAE